MGNDSAIAHSVVRQNSLFNLEESPGLTRIFRELLKENVILKNLGTASTVASREMSFHLRRTRHLANRRVNATTLCMAMGKLFFTGIPNMAATY